MMKRSVLFILMALGVTALVSAQAGNRRGCGAPTPAVSAETVNVTGDLTIVQGAIAVKSGDITYYAGGLQRFVGFIDGLKEGAQVTLEGRAVTSPRDSAAKFLRVSKLTLDGKDYDLAPAVADVPRTMRPYQHMRPNQRLERMYGKDGNQKDATRRPGR
ncbi:MAG: hypothetical protein LBT39_06590 [Treponema sp.]|jgi:hypothetical protein|nr:hypothetical protein [Treponema sp.]